MCSLMHTRLTSLSARVVYARSHLYMQSVTDVHAVVYIMATTHAVNINSQPPHTATRADATQWSMHPFVNMHMHMQV